MTIDCTKLTLAQIKKTKEYKNLPRSAGKSKLNKKQLCKLLGPKSPVKRKSSIKRSSKRRSPYVTVKGRVVGISPKKRSPYVAVKGRVVGISPKKRSPFVAVKGRVISPTKKRSLRKKRSERILLSKESTITSPTKMLKFITKEKGVADIIMGMKKDMDDLEPIEKLYNKMTQHTSEKYKHGFKIRYKLLGAGRRKIFTTLLKKYTRDNPLLLAKVLRHMHDISFINNFDDDAPVFYPSGGRGYRVYRGLFNKQYKKIYEQIMHNKKSKYFKENLYHLFSEMVENPEVDFYDEDFVENLISLKDILKLKNEVIKQKYLEYLFMVHKYKSDWILHNFVPEHYHTIVDSVLDKVKGIDYNSYKEDVEDSIRAFGILFKQQGKVLTKAF